MGLAWFRLGLPRDLLVAVAALRRLPAFVVCNDGGGLKLGVPEKAVNLLNPLSQLGFTVTPTSPPKLVPAEPLAFNPLSTGALKDLRIGAALVVPRPGKGAKLARSYYRAVLLRREAATRPAEEWYDSMIRMNFTYFESYLLRLRAGESEKPLARLLEGGKPHRAKVLLSPHELATLLDALSWARYVNPITREDGEQGLACALTLSREKDTQGREFDVLQIGFKARENNTMLIVGDPGSGKTALLRLLTVQLPRWRWPPNVLIIDFYGEYGFLEAHGYRVLRAGGDLFLNPLRLGPQLAAEVISEVVQAVWGERGGLTPIQLTDVLLPALSASKTLLEAYRAVDAVERSAAREDVKTAAAAVLRRLYAMLTPALLADGEVPKGRVVVDLSRIEGEAAKVAFTLTLLQMLYLRPFPALVIIDDASKLGRECRILDNVIMHLRKYDVHAWAAAQDPELVPPALLQARHTVVFRSASRMAKLLADPVDPQRLEPLNFAYDGKQYRVRLLKAAPTPVKSEPISFSSTAAKLGIPTIDLIDLYVRYLPHRNLITTLRTKGMLSPEERELLREIVDEQIGSRDTAYELADLYLKMGG